MANRRFEMHEYRNILARMRLGESDRDLARAGLMGRRKVAAVRQKAQRAGWLEIGHPLPDDATLAEVFGQRVPKASSASLVLPHADEVRSWWEKDISGVVIHQTLQRKSA